MTINYRKFIKDKCEECEIIDKRLLVVHHIDRDRDNNEEVNLQTLCWNCHKIIHTNINAEIKSLKPEISEVDGMIETIFPKPLNNNLVHYLTLMLAHKQGNLLLGNKKGKIIGFICSKKDFEDLIKENNVKQSAELIE